MQIPIEAYLGMVPLMRPRIYSIANTPGWTPGRLSIVVSVLDEPHWRGSGRFLGAASNHLFDLIAGTSLRLSVKKTNPYLQPPEDPSAYPIVMIAAGSGIAPFMGFIQMRPCNLKTASVYRRRFFSSDAAVRRMISIAPSSTSSRPTQSYR